MWDILKKENLKKGGLFAAGVAFGTAGIKVLSSKDAKKVYTECLNSLQFRHHEGLCYENRDDGAGKRGRYPCGGKTGE